MRRDRVLIAACVIVVATAIAGCGDATSSGGTTAAKSASPPATATAADIAMVRRAQLMMVDAATAMESCAATTSDGTYDACTNDRIKSDERSLASALDSGNLSVSGSGDSFQVSGTLVKLSPTLQLELRREPDSTATGYRLRTTYTCSPTGPLCAGGRWKPPTPGGDSAPPATTAKPTNSAAGETGEGVRNMVIASSYSTLDGVDKHGVRVGAQRGSCTAIDPSPERAGLIAAVKQSDEEAHDVPLVDRDVLVARCGKAYHALALWTVGHSSRADAFDRTASGSWHSVPGDQYPGCATPADAMRLWDIDPSYCN